MRLPSLASRRVGVTIAALVTGAAWAFVFLSGSLVATSTARALTGEPRDGWERARVARAGPPTAVTLSDGSPGRARTVEVRHEGRAVTRRLVTAPGRAPDSVWVRRADGRTQVATRPPDRHAAARALLFWMLIIACSLLAAFCAARVSASTSAVLAARRRAHLGRRVAPAPAGIHKV